MSHISIFSELHLVYIGNPEDVNSELHYESHCQLCKCLLLLEKLNQFCICYPAVAELTEESTALLPITCILCLFVCLFASWCLFVHRLYNTGQFNALADIISTTRARHLTKGYYILFNTFTCSCKMEKGRQFAVCTRGFEREAQTHSYRLQEGLQQFYFMTFFCFSHLWKLIAHLHIT